jgi:hypothetical protein
MGLRALFVLGVVVAAAAVAAARTEQALLAPATAEYADLMLLHTPASTAAAAAVGGLDRSTRTRRATTPTGADLTFVEVNQRACLRAPAHCARAVGHNASVRAVRACTQ